MPDDRRVAFLIAGAQKCGTSAMDAYLRRHPDLQMSREKETHFFDREDGVHWRAPDYGVLHAEYDPDGPTLWGEATPITLYWTPAHYRVLAYNPDMLFVILLRDPVARALSQWRMNRGRGQEPLSFSEAIRAGRTRVLEQGPQTGLSLLYSYVERGFYARQIALLSTLFPPSNMLILTQDALDRDPEATLARVTAFLGVAPLGPVEPIRANVTPPGEDGAMTAEDEAMLRDLYREDLAALERLTGIRL